MSDQTPDPTRDRTGAAAQPKDTVLLSVNLNRQTAEALRKFAERRNIGATEAVRRMVSACDYLDAELEKGHHIVIVSQLTKRGHLHSRVVYWEIKFE